MTNKMHYDTVSKGAGWFILVAAVLRYVVCIQLTVDQRNTLSPLWLNLYSGISNTPHIPP